MPQQPLKSHSARNKSLTVLAKCGQCQRRSCSTNADGKLEGVLLGDDDDVRAGQPSAAVQIGGFEVVCSDDWAGICGICMHYLGSRQGHTAAGGSGG